MRLAATALILGLLAGCVGPTSGPAKVSLVNGPSLTQMMPGTPDGFRLGFETKDDSHLSRVFDYSRNNATIYHSLTIAISRYDSPDVARAAFESMRTVPQVPVPDHENATRDFVSSEQILGDSREPSAMGFIERAYGVRGLFIVTVFEQTRGEQALTNVTTLAEDALSAA